MFLKKLMFPYFKVINRHIKQIVILLQIENVLVIKYVLKHQHLV